MEYCFGKIVDLNGDRKAPFPVFNIFAFACMRFNYFVYVSIFTVTHVLFKFITFIAYFILILLLLFLLKNWGFK